ncbi:MAG: lipid-A-disaccharide synthase N-terminal domain-containing protein [Planctomycetes bacterium]|nr:lipid-A-disaccharide synthase N-terminal domain-containing protein [Planctomycetota bacterium]
MSADTLWLAFGWAAQALFTARFLVQWLAAERAGAAVVPPAFWWLSLCGGVALGIYFLKRHDPVGVVGQMAPVAIYVRNLFLHYRKQKADAGIGATPARA